MVTPVVLVAEPIHSLSGSPQPTAQAMESWQLLTFQIDAKVILRMMKKALGNLIVFLRTLVALGFWLGCCAGGFAQHRWSPEPLERILPAVPGHSNGGDLRPGILASDQREIGGVTYAIQIFRNAEIGRNIVFVRDVAAIQAPPAIAQRVGNILLAPAPPADQVQRWTRRDIEDHFAMRGLDPDAFRFIGSQYCDVRWEPTAVVGNLSPASDVAATVDSNTVTQATTFGPAFENAATSTFNAVNNETSLGEPFKDLNSSSLAGNRTTPSGTTPPLTGANEFTYTPSNARANTILQAQRNTRDAIMAYLAIKTGEDVDWKIDVDIPVDSAALLLQRRAIRGVAGGQAPWVGMQNLVVVVKSKNGELTVPVRADISLPPLVVAAKGPIRRDQLLVAEDLKMVSLPSNSRLTADDLFTSIDELVGKEVIRSLSTGQPVPRAETRSPRIIDRGSLVQIQVVSGNVTVETSGKAIESGGLHELITVEVIPHRKRLVGEIVGDGLVRVVSVGVGK